MTTRDALLGALVMTLCLLAGCAACVLGTLMGPR
jgi:hypothetical protein